ncbi:MarR family winged helix-turn-helix transcriptional regulator [Vagococcus intermedius]|uniref:MarR family transcriptional regulator n=1 Tax=Vagococcus intermedius TaxID=2991418 RepID=A0AAF0I6G3_9ENTE|nr:MarR family transcriptional regulator [Vagococcus intermedius]WEG72660.1 MarR family transcriptional regulator [Vagococcus intermedius]WEG74745.1 MarR family transcriptional regulator [Vagococcus intermedius]
MIKADAHTVNAFIKSFLNYLTFLEKEMANDSFNFNELRIIFELWEQGRMPAKNIESELDLDKGYTSRILKRLMNEGIIQREQSSDDRRLYYISFTEKGQKLAQELYNKYEKIIIDDYSQLSSEEQIRFMGVLEVIKKIDDNKRSH